MNAEIKMVVDVVSNEKDVPKETVFEAIESALESATKKRYGANWDVKVSIDRKTGEYKTWRRWTVISDDKALNQASMPQRSSFDFYHEDKHDDYVNPDAEFTLDQLKDHLANSNAEDSEGSQNIKSADEYQVGDEYLEPIQSIDFGRIAAQTAKQVIMQKLRAAKREQVANEYKSRVGELINGTVKKVTRENIFLDLGNNAEAVLRRQDMLPKEIFRISDRVRAYLQEVTFDQKGPQLRVSRVCPEMLIELFKIEVPEINDGLIALKGAARDPGVRAKVAVQAKDNRIDPVGACVGMRGARVQAVSTELGGERVDIVLWDDNLAQFIINSIAPAEVSSIVIDDENHSVDVIVEEENLSQAIGRNGQNVRLASMLTGWELNVISAKQAAEQDSEELNKIITEFVEKLEIETTIATNLAEFGFSTLEEIAYVPVEELLEVEGVDNTLANSLQTKAKDLLLTQAISMQERIEENEPNQDLLEVEGVDKSLAYILVQKGIISRDDLAEQSVDDLLEIEGMDEKRAGKLIMAARAHWFNE